MTTEAVNVNDRLTLYDIYIGRPSEWGNPYIPGRHGTREECIAKYEKFVRAKPEMVERVKQVLKGKRLGCYCKPLPCHGDVLARIADEG